MKWVKIILLILFTAGLFYFLSKIDYLKAIETIKNSNYTFLLITLVIVIFTYTLKVFRLMIVSAYYDSKINFKHSLFTQITAIFFASFTPGRIGELSKIFLLKKYKVKGIIPFAITVLERALDLFIVMIFGFLFIMWFVKIKEISLIVALLGLAIGFFILLLLKLDKLKRFIPKKYQPYFDGLKVDLKDPKLYFIFFLTALTWTLDGIGFYFITQAFDIQINVMVAIGLFCALIVLSLISFLPSGIGALEISAFYLFEILGITNEQSLAVLLMLRIITFLVPTVLMGSIAPFAKFNIFNIKEKLKKQSNI